MSFIVLICKMKVCKFEELRSWQEARKLNEEIFCLINNGKFNNDYPLKDQMNRSSASIMDNIAEGFERNGNKEFIQFLCISKGSTGELKSQLFRALDRNKIDQGEFENFYAQADRIARMNSKHINYLLNTEKKGWKYNSR
jgi:four helix bundle protein